MRAEAEARAAAKAIEAGLRKAEVIAILHGDFALPYILEIGDALLAAPILALEISLTGANSLEAVFELRQRAGEHMLIGAGDVQTREQVSAALAAEAQFIISPTLNPSLIAEAQTQDWLHLPTVSSLAEARRATMAGCHLIKANGLSAEDVQSLTTAGDNDFICCCQGVTLSNLTQYRRAGTAVVATASLIIGPAPTMADIITRARSWSAAWKRAIP